jgi:riboflavin biosynthesis pyrimidine reductase
MAVIATLVVGADGSTTKDGSSQGVTSGADRAHFLEHRRLADCILIGGNTARTEPYARTPVPVVVISRNLIKSLASNPLAHCWNLSPVAGLNKAIEIFGPRIHVEAGASIISELIAAGRIDQLELSITSVTGGELKVDIDALLGAFTTREERVIDGTRMISASK